MHRAIVTCLATAVAAAASGTPRQARATGMVTTAARGSRTNPAVSGTRNTSNNYVIDGMSTNEERVGVAGLAPGSPSGLAGAANSIESE